MRRLALPPAFARYEEILGVLKFCAFAGIDALTEAIALDAIAEAIPNLDRDALRDIGFRSLGYRDFLGEWCDPLHARLIARGSRSTHDGRQLVDPYLEDLEGLSFQSGASEIPEAGSGGNFAYAFSHPPYGLQASPREVQSLFDEVLAFLLPPGQVHVIQDWSSPRLPEAAERFDAGMEWWGVFLFVVFLPAERRLVVIVGSTTD